MRIFVNTKTRLGPFRRALPMFWLVGLSVFLLSACKDDGAQSYQATATLGSPVILWNTVITLSITPAGNEVSAIDLDRAPNSGDETGVDDLVFEVSSGTITTYYLRPVNSSAVMLGPVDASYDDCLNNADRFSSGSIPELVDGNLICLLTDEGRFAKVKIEQVRVESATKAFIDLNVVVWEKAAK